MKNPAKWLWAVLVLVILAVLFIFMQIRGVNTENAYFDATVLSVNNNFILVQAEENQAVSGTVEVSTEGLSTEEISALEEGMKICIEYDGKMTRSIPARVPEVRSIKILE